MFNNLIEEIIQKDNEQHPISQEDFEYWSSLHVTKRLFRDLQLVVLEGGNAVGGNSIEQLAASAATQQAMRRLKDEILEWKPEELEKDET